MDILKRVSKRLHKSPNSSNSHDEAHERHISLEGSHGNSLSLPNIKTQGADRSSFSLNDYSSNNPNNRSSKESRSSITEKKRKTMARGSFSAAFLGSSNTPNAPSYVPVYNKFKVAVVGANKTGKTRFCIRYAHNIYSEHYEYEETIQDTYTKTISLNLTDYYQEQGIGDNEPHARDITVDLEIYDMGGGEDCEMYGETKWDEMDGFILMYDVSNKDSFKALQSFYDRIIGRKQRLSMSGSSTAAASNSASKVMMQMPLMLVANKVDLPGTAVQISAENGSKMARGLGSKLMLASAQNNSQVDECFVGLIKEILNCRYMRPDAELFMSLFGSLATESSENRMDDRKSMRELKDLVNKRLSRKY